MSIIVRMPHVFGPRWPEWLGAASATFAGLGLLHPYEAFESPAFVNFNFGPHAEVIWGAFLFFIGVLRFTALIINGRRKRVTPWMRMTGAAVTFLVFLGFSLGLLTSGVMSTWIGSWPVLALMEYVNIIRASQDARIGYGRSN